MQGGLVWNKLQWHVYLLSQVRRLSSDSSPVCHSDNACKNFPIRGDITSLDAKESVNMTCYKGGETVFNNHQFCDVTSKRMIISVLDSS
jgi:hypothetical protein